MHTTPHRHVQPSSFDSEEFDLPPSTGLSVNSPFAHDSPFYVQQQNVQQQKEDLYRQTLRRNGGAHTPGGASPISTPSLRIGPTGSPRVRTGRTPHSTRSLRSGRSTMSFGDGGGVSSLKYTPKSRKLQSLWVTVYGFEAATMGSDVLTLFEKFGDILDHRSGLKNSMDLMFSNKEEAEYALAQDGLRVNIGPDQATCLMIGVKPCAKPPVGADQQQQQQQQQQQRPATPAQSNRRRRRTPSARRSAGGGGRRIRPRPPPEMETESRHGRSTFQHSDQGTSRRYAAVRSSGFKREPRKDLSCCQMALRYLCPS